MYFSSSHYSTLSHVHLVTVKILTKGSLTLTLMPYIYIYIYLWYYSLVRLGFLICPCNEPLINDSQNQTVLGHRVRKHPKDLRTQVNKATKLKILLYELFLGLNTYVLLVTNTQLNQRIFLIFFLKLI